MFSINHSKLRVLHRSFHLGFVIVSQQTAVVVERWGKFYKTLDPGFHFLVPVMDRNSYSHSLKEEVYPISQQMAITKDNVTITIDGVLYLKVVDPYKASYGVGNPVEAMVQLAQTTMRSELGKLTFDKTFEERESLNSSIVRAINEAAEHWGMECKRYEIRDINPPANIRKAMELQSEAERQKRADILSSEGKKQSDINKAEGMRTGAILQAEGEARAILTKANATAQSIHMLSKSIHAKGGYEAVKLRIAEQYVESFSRLAKENTTMIVPSDSPNIASTIAQAVGVYDSVSPKEKSSTKGSGPRYINPILESSE